MAHVSEQKKKELQRITKILKEAKHIGILDLTSLPSAQFQKIKSQLKDRMQVTVTKKSILKLALEKVKSEKQGLEQLEEELKGCIPALLTTKEDAFKIARILDKNKSNMDAKPGQVTPINIIIPEGPTAFPPGPIIGELGQAGIIASVENGKVTVKKEKLLAKAGDTLTAKQTSVIAKFGIKPIEVGLNLKAIYQDGQIFKHDVLSIKEEEYINNIKLGASEALNLAVFITYATQETTEILLQKAEREALALSSKVPSELEVKETTTTDETRESQINQEVKES